MQEMGAAGESLFVEKELKKRIIHYLPLLFGL